MCWVIDNVDVLVWCVGIVLYDVEFGFGDFFVGVIGIGFMCFDVISVSGMVGGFVIGLGG